MVEIYSSHLQPWNMQPFFFLPLVNFEVRWDILTHEIVFVALFLFVQSAQLFFENKQQNAMKFPKKSIWLGEFTDFGMIRCCLPPSEILRKRWQHLVVRPSCHWWWWCNSPCHHRWPIWKGAATDSILRFLCQVAAGSKISQTNFNAAQLSFSILKWTKQSNNSGSVGWKFAWEFIQISDVVRSLWIHFVGFVQSVSTMFPPHPQRFSSFFQLHFNPGKVWMWILWLPTPAKSPINSISWTASPSHVRPRNSSRWMRIFVMSVTRRWNAEM